MPSIARLHNLQDGTIAFAGDVNDDFNQLITTVNALPDKNGTLQANLNADLLDGFHASATGGTDKIPVCNTTLQTALNAEFVGGLAASDIADAGFPVGTRLIFAQAAVPAGWTEVSRPSVDRVLGWGSSAAGGSNNAETSWGNLANYFKPLVGNHVLTITEMPAHTHTLTQENSVGGLPNVYFPLNQTGGNPIAQVTSSTGGGAAHTHENSSLTDGAAPASSYRPPIHWTIIGSKN